MKVNIDGYELDLSIAGGALIVVHNASFRGSISLADPVADPEPVVLAQSNSNLEAL